MLHWTSLFSLSTKEQPPAIEEEETLVVSQPPSAPVSVPIIEKVVTPPKAIEEQVRVAEEVFIKSEGFDIDKLARAIARHETWNCTLWYWATHNNCFWIKHWNTAPCPWVPKLAMCKYSTPEESYEAFKIIWNKWYIWMPTLAMAERWTWKDRAQAWLNNVTNFYYN